MAERSLDFKGQPGRQSLFLAATTDICIMGGAAGGGKSYGLLLEPTYHYEVPGFTALFFRRNYPQITMPGGLWDESHNIYAYLGGTPRKGSLDWTFKSGATVTFRHMDLEKDKYKYQGSQVALICFDQLEEFSASQFFFLLSRNRSMCGVRPYMRATCNPDPDSFLREFLSWWIADDGYADLSKQGKVRWFVRVGNRLVWASSKAELAAQFPPPDFEPKSVAFITATVFDNPILLASNPGYLANLMNLPEVDRERLLGDARRGGNWDVRPSAGKVFDRADFEIVDAVPAGGVECRFWDLAATEKEMSGPDPDFTASVLMKKVRGTYYILDCTAEQMDPKKTDNRIKNLASQDLAAAQAEGVRYLLRWEMEGGASGKRDSFRLVQMLGRFDAAGVSPGGKDKMVRARPLASQCTVGNVKLLRGRWNEMWLNHMHNQPATKKKDIMDASSGAFSALVRAAPSEDAGMVEQPTKQSRWAGAEPSRGKADWGKMR